MTEHLATSEQTMRVPRCQAHEPREWAQCERAAGHVELHYVWYPGFGGVQWRGKEQASA